MNSVNKILLKISLERIPPEISQSIPSKSQYGWTVSVFLSITSSKMTLKICFMISAYRNSLTDAKDSDSSTHSEMFPKIPKIIQFLEIFFQKFHQQFPVETTFHGFVQKFIHTFLWKILQDFVLEFCQKGFQEVYQGHFTKSGFS